MKKLLIILFLLPTMLMSCATVSHQNNTSDEYSIYYQAVEKNIPSRLFWIGLWWAYGQEMAQKQQGQSIEKQKLLYNQYIQLNQCLEKSVKNQFYKTILAENIQAYLNQASEQEKSSDKAIFQNEYYQKINQLENDIFVFHAQNKSKEEHTQYMVEKKKLSSEYNKKLQDTVQPYNESLLSPTYYHYFDDKSKWNTALVKQVEICAHSIH